MSSRAWIVAIAASAAIAGFNPGTLSVAQGQETCPPPDPSAKQEQTTQPQTAEPTAAKTDPQTAPAECTPGAPPAATPPPPPAPEPAPEAAPPASDAPAEPAPAPEAPALVAPAPAAALPAPAHTGSQTTSTRQGLRTRRVTPDLSTLREEAAKAKSDAKAKKKSKKAAEKAKRKKAELDKADRLRRKFSSVTVDWTRLDPLALPAFPYEVASTFPGPAFLLPIYQAAAAQYTVPWQVLAAINEIETNFGSNTNVSSAGAIGWMQFMPSTWKRWGVDANGDGEKNPYDPVDAIFSAARYLRAAGSLEDLPRAIFAYNHAGWYVERVSRRATVLGSIPADVLAALTHRGRRDARAIKRATGSRGLLDRHAKVTGIGRVMLMSERRLRRHVLRSKRVHIYRCGRDDIAHKVVNRRVLETLMYLAYRNLEPTVTSLRCGHGYYTASGNVSHHSHGDAVDIAKINDKPILGNQGPGSITDKAVQALLKLGGGMYADEIITLMKYEGANNTFAMGDHADHIHVGFAPRRRIEDTPTDEPTDVRVDEHADQHGSTSTPTGAKRPE